MKGLVFPKYPEDKRIITDINWLTEVIKLVILGIIFKLKYAIKYFITFSIWFKVAFPNSKAKNTVPSSGFMGRW
mgnify:CR=1 FL=1